MNAGEETHSGLPVEQTPLSYVRWRRIILALLATSALTTCVVVNIPDHLPDRVWSHPGHPWCAKCRSGVPCWTFRLAPDGPAWDPGWCFNDVLHGITLGPPPTPLMSLVNGIEDELQNGDHGYYGGVSYALTGRSETVDGHNWTEYRRSAAR